MASANRYNALCLYGSGQLKIMSQWLGSFQGIPCLTRLTVCGTLLVIEMTRREKAVCLEKERMCAQSLMCLQDLVFGYP